MQSNYSIGTHFQYSVEETGKVRAKATLVFPEKGGHNPGRVALEARMLFEALSRYREIELAFKGLPGKEASASANSVYLEAESFSTRHGGDFRDRFAWKYDGERRAAKRVRDELSTYESVVRPK